MFARQFWQQFNQTQQGDQRAQTNRKEGGAPAKILPDDATNRQTQHHRQRRTGRQQAERLGADQGFVDRLQQLIDQAGNASTLAKRAGISHSGLIRYLNGGEPSRKVLMALNTWLTVRTRRAERLPQAAPLLAS